MSISFDEKAHSKHVEDNRSRNFFVLANHSKLLIESIGHFYSNSSHCIHVFDDKAATGTIPIPLY